MAICKHIKAKRCGTSGPSTHDFPCAKIDGVVPTQAHVNTKFYVDYNNPALGGCEAWVVVAVYGCGTLPLFTANPCNSAVDLIACGVGVSPQMFADCDACSATICPPVSGCTDPTASNYNPLAIFDDGSCIPVVISTGSTPHCYCCYNNNVVGVMQQLPIGQSCSFLNGTNGYSDCDSNWTVPQCEVIPKPKNCYCCDGTSAIGINQAGNPIPPGQDCSYYNSPSGNGWYDCDDDWANLDCDSYANDCTCCDNGTTISMGPAPNLLPCSWFNSLGYTNCDLTTVFNSSPINLCNPTTNEHCACCKNGQMTMIGFPLPVGQGCGYWSGMYGWNNCTGATSFNIDDCEDCDCNELIGTGRTDAFDWNQEDDCLEGCCDPNLKNCDVLVVGDNEGVQVYSTTGDNTTHLFDAHSHDIRDIASNQNFIWVYRVVGTGTQIDEYKLVMAPFTNILIRTIIINATDIGNGLTFYGVNAGNTYLTSVNDSTLLLVIPPGLTNTTILPTTVNNFPGITPGGVTTGYKCTGDILTRGMGNSSSSVNNSLDVVLYDNSLTATGSSIQHKVGKIQRLTGTILEEHIISPSLMTGTTKFHSLYVDVPNNRLAGIMTDGRIYELKQSPTLEFGSTTIGHIDFYNSGGTRTVYGATNVDYSDGTCAAKYITYPKTYDCTINGCVDPLDGTGQYFGPTASADCNTLCVITWNCTPGTGYPNCTNVVEMLPWTITFPTPFNITQPYIQSGPDAIMHISIASQGLQYTNFNTIGFYWGVQPVIPGQCSKWSSSGPRGQWKISEMSHPQLTTTLPIQSWAQFIVELNNAGVTTVNLGMSYTQVETALYVHYGPSYQIDVIYEPCICTPQPCICTPLIGTTGTFPSSATCATTCCPPPPCVVCCQSNTSSYTWMSTSPTSPCYCPPASTQVGCISCNKCCTNGTINIMLGANDQNCDCSYYGLWSCYLPPCDKCCYNKQTGMVSPAQLPDCNCKTGEFVVPCNSLPNDIRITCLPDLPSTTASTVQWIDRIPYAPITSTGTNIGISNATKIYVIYDETSLGTSYIYTLKNNVSAWLISNGLTTNNVETITTGSGAPYSSERWMYWIYNLYHGEFPTPNIGVPAYSDDVLVITFIDESNANYHVTNNLPITTPQAPTIQWQNDYNAFKSEYNQISLSGGNFNGVLYPTGGSTSSMPSILNRKQFAIHALQSVSSGNNVPLDGKWQTGTAPRPVSMGGILGGVPGVCSKTTLEKLEISNPNWNGTTPTYGGLDQFGWKINIRFEIVNSVELTNDLNSLL